MTTVAPSIDLHTLRDTWLAQWPDALAAWSKFTKLSEPRWCLDADDEEREGLAGSFAMIRLTDQAVVVSLRGVVENHVEKFSREVLAHEIGHHVYVPASLLDQGRMLARMRRGLPTQEKLAPLIANLYADLLLNDRLQRSTGLDIAGVYKTLAAGQEASSLWALYMRIYEILWSLPRGSLAPVTVATPKRGKGEKAPKIAPPTPTQREGDAQLGARLIRSYARDWLKGAGKFAALCLPYLMEDEGEKVRCILKGWLDIDKSCSGDCIPAGLAEMDEDEEDGAMHPSRDPDLTGVGGIDSEPGEGPTADPELTDQTEGGKGRNLRGGQRQHRNWRGPMEYGEILKALGAKVSDHEITIRYYRERAVPNLIRFPVRLLPEAAEPLPEGLETWDFGMPLEDADWLQSVLASPHVVPGLTTVQRTYGATPGAQPERRPVDLYLGIDCSGSMLNPQRDVSYPVLAGAIIALSALRTGARVMVVLSGEPGQTVATNGFVANEHQVLEVLTGYLGTGYTFGIHRLRDTFGSRKPGDRDAHILLVTDHDIFGMLDEKQGGATGWEVARTSLEQARGGGTYVLHMPPDWEKEKLDRMRGDGWQIHSVQSWEDLVAFARAFSQAHYGEQARGRGRPTT